MKTFSQCQSYVNFYPNINQLSPVINGVSCSTPYTNGINTSKSISSNAVSAPSNTPQHREKFKQIVPRRKFTPDEDKKIKLLVEKLGTDSWDVIAEYMPDRSARQCRDRYRNYLLDYLCQDPWTCEEDQLIMSKFSKIGAHWVQIAKILGRRSGNDVKNRWYKHLSKKYNQKMQEQLQTMAKLEKDEVNEDQLKKTKTQEQKSKIMKFTSLHCQAQQNEEIANNVKKDICPIANYVNKKTENVQKNAEQTEIIQNHSLPICTSKDDKTKPDSIQGSNCYCTLPKNNLPLHNYQETVLENKNINHESQWRNIEYMNIFSNFDHELAFDQTDFTSYIDNFFH